MRDYNKRPTADFTKYGIFETYQDEVNQKILGMIVVVSASFQLLQIYLGGYLSKAGMFYNQYDFGFSVSSFVTLVLFLGMYGIVHWRYKVFPEIISVVVIGFTLGHQIQTFLIEPSVWISLVFWSVLVLMISMQYIGPGISLPLIVASYGWFILGIYYYDIPVSNYVPFILVLLGVVLLCVLFAFTSARKARKVFEYNTNINENYAEFDKKLNFDELTGLPSNYALDAFVKRFQPKDTDERIHIVVFDLDHMKLCNTVYGRESGDAYLQTFAKIIRFLVKGSRDMVARISGDKFVAVLTSYRSTAELEKRLERYNHLLRDEFDKDHNDRKFMAWFSYGLVQAKNLDNYPERLNEAEKKLYKVKEQNKRYLMTKSHLMTDINYLSLFSESNITVIVWMPSEGWPVGFVTENIQDLLGYESEAFINATSSFADYMHPSEVESVFEDVSRYLDNKVDHFEQIYRLRKADGSYIWVRDYSVPVWREGVLVQINGYMYDITLEIEAKQLLMEQEQMFRDIIDATNMGTWEWHIQTDEIHINNRYEEMYGYNPGELLPMTLEDFEAMTHPEDVKRFYELVKEHFAGNTPYYQMECRVRHKDGSWIWILDRGKVMKWTEDGRPQIMVGAQTDITELKATEARLRQSEKLNAIGRMAGGIAHDMNNFLMMMSGYIGLAEERDDLEFYRESLPVIDGLLTRASDTVKQIMSFTKHHMFAPAIIDLRRVLEEMGNIIDRTFEKNLLLTMRIPDEPMIIRGDQSLIDNALLNLCLNARDAMEIGGELILSLTEVHLTNDVQTLTGQLPEGRYACIRVKDDGIGIDDDSLEKIFEPFFTTKEFGGGIGLAMVVSVVKEHGGDLMVASEKDNGTEFSLYFPLAAEESAKDLKEVHNKTVTPKVQEVSNEDGLSVMIVDDEPVLSEVLFEFLSEKNCKPKAFTMPKEALAYYEEHHEEVDVVILDMLMPEMNGTEVFKAMLEIDPNTKVLYLSGYSDGVEISDEIKNNIMGFMKKPVKLNELYKRLIEKN